MMYLRTVWVFLNLLMSVLVVGPAIILLSLFVKDQRVYSGLVRFWASWNVAAAGMKVKLEGLENVDRSRRYVVMGNHESSLDIFLVLALIPLELRIVAKAELQKLPLVGAAMARALFPFVDRRNHRKAVESLNRTFAAMSEYNLSVFIYPEGTRGGVGKMIPFKKGGFVLAIERQLPILPVMLEGAGKINPPGTIWVKDTDVTMTFLPVVETVGLTLADRDGLKDRVFGVMSEFQSGPA